jgi:uncharacterized protein HemY
MSNEFLFNIRVVGIEYVFEILILLLLFLLLLLLLLVVVVVIRITWTYAKLKKWFVHTLKTNKCTGKHEDGGC